MLKAVIIGIFLTLIGCSIFPSFSVEKAKIIRVSDGDTIVVENLHSYQKEKVRIWGIDTPEKFESKKLYREVKKCHTTPERIKYLGILASKHAHLYLYEGEEVKLEKIGKGYYGRIIGKIYLPDGKDYGFLMVKDGYACVYWRNTSPQYKKAMEEAKEEKRGLWKVDYELMKCLCY